ncbi:MAG: alpha/beta fold hydrolase [Cyanobacteria bacterium Co-bin8]|nr:alpha/beta fold hydrolase [Cyanobacteria bacterium Co-bin8]
MLAILSLVGFTYASTCFFLLVWQRHLIYRPKPELSMVPGAAAFNMPYEDVWVPIAGSQGLHGWWIPAASPQESFSVLANEPAQVLPSAKAMLYLCGVGRNMGDYNYLARAAAFRQLGFSVLVFDYRGYGRSEGSFPSEDQVYADSQAAWDYLHQVRGFAPDQIVIYGESLGGAIALDLALKQPEAGGLIMQSSFTSMTEVIQHRPLLKFLPIDWLLTEQFNSLDKIQSLQMPVLFLHGIDDSVVPAEMSQQLYAAAPEPKQLFLITGADHVRIYQPGERSYLKAIASFIESLPR